MSAPTYPWVDFILGKGILLDSDGIILFSKFWDLFNGGLIGLIIKSCPGWKFGATPSGMRVEFLGSFEPSKTAGDLA